MRNPYKKFQNSSIHGSKVMLCIEKRDERTDGRTNNPEAICPSNFFEVGGIKSVSDSEEGALLTENKYFYICIHVDRLQAVRAVERIIK